MSIQLISSILFICVSSSFSMEMPHTTSDININSLIDETLPDIRAAIKRGGFDPMKVPKISDYITPVYLNLTNGVMLNAAKIERSGDFYLAFHPGVIRTYANVYFDEMIGEFDYSIRSFGFYKDTGRMRASIQNVTVGVSIDFHLANFTFQGFKIDIEHVEFVEIKMESDSYINWLKNIIVNVAIPHYKGNIVNIAEKTSLRIAKKVLKWTNKNMKQWTIDTFMNLINQYNRG